MEKPLPKDLKLKCLDCSNEFKYSELIVIKKRQRCPECGSLHYQPINLTDL